MLVVFLVILSYLLPVMAGAMVQTDPDQWHSGSFAEISKLIPGCTNGWLQIWLIVAGGISGIAI